MKKQISIKKSEMMRFIRKFRIEPNSIVAFSANTITTEGADQLAAAIAESGIKGVVVLVVEDVSRMDIVNEKEMNKLGWFRVQALRNALRIKTDADDKSKIANPSGEPGELPGDALSPEGNQVDGDGGAL